ncbi:MAG: hypothetical protein ACRD4L_11610, partial [Pyrinomonadaceae bacterium]
SNQLGFYQGLIEDTLHYMSALPRSGKKLRDLYKQIDLALRQHISRIELIGRETPAEFIANVRIASTFTQSARFTAINGFFGEDVIKLEEKNVGKKENQPESSPDKMSTEPGHP